MDELERDLAGLGEPRPLPPALRQRLERALAEHASAPPARATAQAAENPLAGIDAPRPLPSALEEGLVASLAGEAAPLPRRVRHRVRAALSHGSPGRRPVAVALAAAAAVIVLAATVGTLVRTGGQAGPAHRSLAAGSGGAGAAPLAGVGGGAAGSSGEPAAAQGAPAAPGDNTRAQAAARAAGPVAGAPGASAALAAPTGQTAPPPFAFDPDATGTPVPQTGQPVSIGVAGGDPAEEAGFRAYVQRLNAAGGAGGHTFALVAVSPGGPAAKTAVTVNLSGAPLAGPAGPPAWAGGPLLEGLAAPESATRGDVFDLASPPERQAHLLAGAVFPEAAPGATAVVYQASSGVLGTDVPAAFDAVLRARGVTPVHVVYHARDPVSPVHADAVLLSLDTSTSSDWLDRARSAGVAAPRGIAGLYPLLDASLLPRLPSGTRVESPYLQASGAEAAAMQQGSRLPPGDAVTHGWVTAKALAVAVWRSGAVDATAMRAALSGLIGYADGFAPPYQTRPGDNARQPEGVLFTVRDGAFAVTGAFRADPF